MTQNFKIAFDKSHICSPYFTSTLPIAHRTSDSLILNQKTQAKLQYFFHVIKYHDEKKAFPFDRRNIYLQSSDFEYPNLRRELVFYKEILSNPRATLLNQGRHIFNEIF